MIHTVLTSYFQAAVRGRRVQLLAASLPFQNSICLPLLGWGASLAGEAHHATPAAQHRGVLAAGKPSKEVSDGEEWWQWGFVGGFAFPSMSRSHEEGPEINDTLLVQYRLNLYLNTNYLTHDVYPLDELAAPNDAYIP